MRSLLMVLALGCSPEADPLPVTQAPTQLARCADDLHERNDSIAEALPWVDEQLVVTSSSDDYWSFEIPSGNRFELVVDFDHEEGWGGIELYNEAGEILDAGVSAPYGVKLVWINTKEELTTVYARSTIYEGDCDVYDMSWMSFPVDCPVDPIEDNDTQAEAQFFDDGQFDMVELDDPDWWKVDLPPHSVTGVGVEQPWSFADLALDLYDGRGRFINNGGTDGRITNDSDVAQVGTGEVMINNFTNRGVCAPYLLHWRTVIAECPEEPVEDDFITDARTVDIGPVEGSVRYYDDDWIRVVVPDNMRLWIEGEVDPLIGQTWLWLHDNEGTYTIADAARPYALHAENRTGGPSAWHLQIQAAEQLVSCVPYTLDMGLVSCDREDVLEPNNTLQQALPLPVGQTVTVTETDPDVWFVENVPPGWRLDVDIHFRESLGRVEGQLVLADGTVLYEGQGDWGVESMVFINPTQQDQPIYLKTSLPPLFNNCAQQYDVAVTLAP